MDKIIEHYKHFMLPLSFIFSDIPSNISDEDKAFTIAARKYITDNWKNGCRCPCCNDWIEIKEIPFTKKMVDSLQRMNEYTGKQSVTYLKLYNLTDDLYNLQRWGLVLWNESLVEWVVTNAGKEFIAKKSQLPKNIYIYEGAVYYDDKEFAVTVEQIS